MILFDWRKYPDVKRSNGNGRILRPLTWGRNAYRMFSWKSNALSYHISLPKKTKRYLCAAIFVPFGFSKLKTNVDAPPLRREQMLTDGTIPLAGTGPVPSCTLNLRCLFFEGSEGFETGRILHISTPCIAWAVLHLPPCKQTDIMAIAAKSHLVVLSTRCFDYNYTQSTPIAQ